MPTILYVDPTAVHGGAEEVLVSFMECGIELGYQPVLAVPSEGWLTQQCAERGIPFEIITGMPDATASETWSQQFKPWLSTARKISQVVQKWRPIIVHSNSPRVSYHGGLGARMAGGCATITHVHDIYGTPFASPRKTRLLSYLADGIITPSHAVEDAILQHAPQLTARVQTVYNGWDMDAYAGVQPADLTAMYGIPQDAIVIGCASSMTPLKGQDVLIAAFHKLRPQMPKAHLLIVGGVYGENREHKQHLQKLRQQVTDLGLDQSVTFTGWREDVWSHMLSMDVFVHVPTQPDSLPTAVIHASALGRPIVASRSGGIPEIVLDNKTGLIVPMSDSDSLARALAWLFADPARGAQFGEAARRHFLQRFSHKQMLQGLASAYEKSLERKQIEAVRGHSTS